MATTNWQYYADGGFFIASVTGMESGDSALSTIINMKGYMLCDIILPSAWTTAALSFLIAHDDATFQGIFNIDGELNYSSTVAAASRTLGVKPEHAMQLQGAMKLRSGLAGATVNQAASRTISLIAWKFGQ